MTLVCGTAGYDGTSFKNLLAEKYNIQLNKTSRNSVLLQSNINNTRSDVALLIKVLLEISMAIDRRLADGGATERAAFDARVKSLMEDVPDLPNFSRFHDGYRENPASVTLEGDMRSAFFAAYDEGDCEYVPLMDPRIDERLAQRPGDGVRQFRDPLPARLSDHGAGAGHRRGHHRLHAQARREGNPWLQRHPRHQADQAVSDPRGHAGCRRRGAAQAQIMIR